MGAAASVLFYQFFGANSQDFRGCGDHLAREGKVNVQMPDHPDESLPRSKTAVDQLPPPDIKRWTARRKAAVVDAVLGGVITMEEVCRRYDLSVDEFLSWHNAMARHGLPGLRTTRLQNYRYSRPKKG